MTPHLDPHGPFWDEPRTFSRWEAWQWLLRACPFERTCTRPLPRRELAGAWQWGEKRVRSFLAELQERGYLQPGPSGRSGTVYTIQLRGQQKGQEKGRQKGPQKGQEKGRNVDERTEVISRVLGGRPASRGQQKGQQKGREKGQVEGQEKGQHDEGVRTARWDPANHATRRRRKP